MSSQFAEDLRARRAARETTGIPGAVRPLPPALPPKKVRPPAPPRHFGGFSRADCARVPQVLPKLQAAAVGLTPQKEHGNIAFGIAQEHYAKDWDKARDDTTMDVWPVDVVTDWVHRVRRMPQYVNSFLDEEIDGARLLGLMPRTKENELEWKHLGVSVKDRIQISKAVRQYVEHEVEIDGGDEEAAGGFGKLLSMWEKGYVPEVDEEVEAEEKELLALVRQEQAKLLLDRKSNLEHGFAGAKQRTVEGQAGGGTGAEEAAAVIAAADAEPEPELAPEPEIDASTAAEYLEIIPEMETKDLIAALAEIGETTHYDDDEEMRELLTMFYEDHLGVTSSEEEEEEEGEAPGEESDDDGSVGDFSALDKALEESEHFNKDSPWVEFKDDDTGKSYYFNSDTEETSWKMPEAGISGYGADESDDEDDSDDENEEGESGEDNDGEEEDEEAVAD